MTGGTVSNDTVTEAEELLPAASVAVAVIVLLPSFVRVMVAEKLSADLVAGVPFTITDASESSIVPMTVTVRLPAKAEALATNQTAAPINHPDRFIRSPSFPVSCLPAACCWLDR